MKTILAAVFVLLCVSVNAQTDFNADSFIRVQNIEIIIPTFRGSVERNWYGWGEPNRLDVIWKFYLGEGTTVISRKAGKRKWKGAGWTGQPLVVKEGNDTFLIQGAYDHHLRKINALTGREVWKYKFDDVVKGTGSLWLNRNARNPDESLIIMQGSRLGVQHFLDTKYVPSYRAVSCFSGYELWRMNSRLTRSYSRDVDASCLVYRDTAYLGLENGVFTVFDPDPAGADTLDGMFQPQRFENHMLYNSEDVRSHGGNLVTESSPALLADHIYLASGSGHVYGYNLTSGKMDWDFYVGSDMDGSIVVTDDSCLLVSVEKQYIKGRGGVFKLDPFRKPENPVVWYFPVKDTAYAGWEGGIIGTAAVNDIYLEKPGENLAVFSALDGYTYMVFHKKTVPGKFVSGPSGKGKYPTPILFSTYRTGPSISSPVLTANRIIACSYNGIYLFSYNDKEIKLLDRLGIEIESSPVIVGNRIFIASRNGYLYCLGEKP